MWGACRAVLPRAYDLSDVRARQADGTGGGAAAATPALPLVDARFIRLFEDAAFEIDPESEAYRLRHSGGVAKRVADDEGGEDGGGGAEEAGSPAGGGSDEGSAGPGDGSGSSGDDDIIETLFEPAAEASGDGCACTGAGACLCAPHTFLALDRVVQQAGAKDVRSEGRGRSRWPRTRGDGQQGRRWCRARGEGAGVAEAQDDGRADRSGGACALSERSFLCGS